MAQREPAVLDGNGKPRCHLHADADVVECRNDSCEGRWLCLSAEPHHLDIPPQVVRNRIEMRYLICQVQSWLDGHQDELAGALLVCPRCEHPMVSGWRA